MPTQVVDGAVSAFLVDAAGNSLLDSSGNLKVSIGSITAAVNIVASSSTAFTVAKAGTNYIFQVDTATGSAVAGLKLTGAATGGTVAVAVIDTGSDANLTIDAKGSGTIGLNVTGTGAITLGRATTITTGGLTVTAGNLTLSAGVATIERSTGGAGPGSNLTLRRTVAAANDGVGLTFQLQDSAAANTSYAAIYGLITSPTDGAETGSLDFHVAAAGALTSRMTLSTAGLLTVAGGLTVTAGGATITAGNLTMTAGRVLAKQGADVASATNLVLGTDGNVFEITGTTKIDLISNLTWQNGSVITLIANESVVIDHGTATSTTNITIRLAGAVDYSMTAGDTLTLVLSETTAEGQAWREISRAVI